MLLVLVGTLTACSTPKPPPQQLFQRTAQVEAILDPKYSLTPQSPIALSPEEKTSIEDRKFGALLSSQLATNAFNVVNRQQADFIIAYSTTNIIASSESYSFLMKHIWLKAYATTDLRVGKVKTSWEGRIYLFASDYDKNPVFVIRTLLSYFGKDFQGEIRLRE